MSKSDRIAELEKELEKTNRRLEKALKAADRLSRRVEDLEKKTSKL